MSVPDEPVACCWPAIPPPGGVRLPTLPAHECPYLPGRAMSSRAFWSSQRLGEAAYERLLDAGFRRSGRLVYQPVCATCRACVPLRVPAATFAPSKGQRRVLKRSADVRLTVEPNVASDEKWRLYAAYVRDWHGREPDGREEFDRFLYDSPVRTLDFCYRDGAGRLLAVGVCDLTATVLSSVYFYFDPAEKARSPGTLGALLELAWCRKAGVDSYHLGYRILGCAAMEYKRKFRPEWQPRYLAAPGGLALPRVLPIFTANPSRASSRAKRRASVDFPAPPFCETIPMM